MCWECRSRTAERTSGELGPRQTLCKTILLTHCMYRIFQDTSLTDRCCCRSCLNFKETLQSRHLLTCLPICSRSALSTWCVTADF